MRKTARAIEGLNLAPAAKKATYRENLMRLLTPEME
jgi:hypothetical protein